MSDTKKSEIVRNPDLCVTLHGGLIKNVHVSSLANSTAVALGARIMRILWCMGSAYHKIRHTEENGMH